MKMQRWMIGLAMALMVGVPVFAGGAEADGAIAAIDGQIAKAEINKSDAAWRTHLPKPQQVSFTKGKSYVAVMKTNQGTMKIKLLPEVAPMHVTSFIYLARLGFYDGLTFHRVIPGFMAQGGCPLGNGTGGPGYRMGLEIKMNARHSRRGILSTANSGAPNTDGSQFFITFKNTAFLDGKYTVYGEVTDGLETLDAMEKLGTRSGRTTAPIKIEKVTIEVI